MLRTLWLLLAVVFANHAAALAAEPDDKKEPLPAQEIALRTGDGMNLVSTYYPSKLGKNAVPVILLHGAKGSRADFEALAARLQLAGHAVIAPDLRGHGDSAVDPDGARLVDLRYGDYEAMVAQDMEAVKRFVLAQNNIGALNVEKLCLVALDANAVVALNWAAQDWSWPPLTTGKQGQDVKALVLISPEFSVKGFRTHDALLQPNVRGDVNLMFIVGKTSKGTPEARRIYNSLERFRQGTSVEGSPRQNLFFRAPTSALAGARLLHEGNLKVDDMIAKFIELRLVKQPMPWNVRPEIQTK